jgi:NAD-dependent SIR2 family protein deacetylase
MIRVTGARNRKAASRTASRPVREAVKFLRESKRVAVFLGAGASKDFGYPLTGELLEGIFREIKKPTFLPLLEGDEPDTDVRNRQLLHDYLKDLMPGESLERRNLPLVTALLSLLDFSLASGQSVLPRRSTPETRRARRLLERAILEVINDEEKFSRPALRHLRHFYQFLRHLRVLGTPDSLDVVTTNYDMAADEAVCEAVRVKEQPRGEWNHADMGRKIDFGFNWCHPTSGTVFPRIVKRPSRPQASLFKLHGSTNWLKCPLCDNVYIDAKRPIWQQAYRITLDHRNQCHCSPTMLEAQIVSPSFVREMREPNLLSVWKGALDALRRADHWLIIGYSFPDEDLAVRALFTRAYGSRNQRRPPLITVVQKNRQAFNRYDAFFNASSELKYCTGGLQTFLREWRQQR